MGNDLATGRIRFATYGFQVGHMRDRSLVGEVIDFDGWRNCLVSMTERRTPQETVETPWAVSKMKRCS